MATGPLLLLLVAAVPGLAGRVEAGTPAPRTVDVAVLTTAVKAAETAVRHDGQRAEDDRAASPAMAVRSVRTVAACAALPCVAPSAPPDAHTPRRLVWRSPAPPQGPPAAARP